MQNKIKFTHFNLILLLFATFVLTGSCGLYKKTDARDLPSSGLERAKKNIDEGRGISLKKLGGRGNSTFQFSSSNPLWRATLETLDFLPFANLWLYHRSTFIFYIS